MAFRFGPFELDADRFELRRDGARLAVEPQVVSLMLLLVDNRHRLVTRDEIIQAVWNGRIVSEAALSSRIKSARQALGDDGQQQRMIRTIHGKGFRFVHDIEVTPEPALPARAAVRGEEPEVPPASVPARPSIAVLPFRLLGPAGCHALIAEALPCDLIAELARLRWLFVIARGSSFRFGGPDPDIGQIGAVLGVRYCLTGTIEESGDRLAIAVELTDTRDRGIVWSERYAARAGDIHEIRSRIAASTVAALASHGL